MKKLIIVILWVILWTLIQPLEIVSHYLKGLIGGIMDICEIESEEKQNGN